MNSAAAPPDAGAFGRFEISLAERRLRVDGQPAALGSRAFDLLAALLQRRDRVVPKEELIDLVWPGLVVEDNNLQVQISALRKVLGAAAIATVPGRGYQFTLAPGRPSAQVAPGAASASPVVAATTPALPAALIAAAASSAAAREITSGMPRVSRLLVADDNKVNRLLLCRSLALMGHEVSSADNGRRALEMLRGERFDLLLLDLEMPELDGFGLLEQRAGDPALREVPVIVTSSLEGVGQVARCIELGADDYLHKPVNPMLLKARVEASLERKHGRDRERELLARLAHDLPQATRATSARRSRATVLVARLRGEDPLHAASAQEALELASSWTTLMLDAVEGQGGLTLQMTGESISAVFGSEALADSVNDAAWAAAQAAREMQALVALFNAERTAAGKRPMSLGVGVATGEVVTGQAETPRRAAFVCVGEASRRAAELASVVDESSRDLVLLDEPTHAALAGRLPTESIHPPARPRTPTASPVYVLKPT